MKKITIINGPNLNLLGTREPELYGKQSLQGIIDRLNKLNLCELTHFQSNHEGEIVEFIQSCQNKIDFIIINAGAYTHTSVAIRDSLLAVSIPFYEVHITNVFSREKFREKSYISDIAVGVLSGFGIQGYELALKGAINFLENKS